MKRFKYSQINPFEQIFISRHLHFKEEEEHIHDFFEFALIYEGRGVHTVNGKSFDTRMGDIILMEPGSEHFFIPHGKMGLLNCIFEPEFISDKLEGCASVKQLSMFEPFRDFDIERIDLPITLYGNALTEIESILDNMLGEFEKKDKGYIEILRASLIILVTRLLRFPSPGKNEADIKSQKIPPEVLSFIRRNYNKNLTLEELAHKCFYNPAYFSTLFKKNTGLTLSQFIFQTRMENTLKYLTETTLSINKIISITGFHNKSHFYKKFYECTGMSPNEYRNRKNKT